MKVIKKFLGYFTAFELLLWSVSVTAVLTCHFVFHSSSYLTLVASLVGVSSLIFCAKGNPIGQVLMIIFSLLYGIISYNARYYGEMITYIGMTAPMAVLALIVWLKNPYKGNKSEVAIGSVKGRDIAVMTSLTLIVTLLSYFLLKVLGTASLIPSTVSVTTSFIAAYLTYLRSPFLSLAYAANDAVLILLWILAATRDPSAVSAVVCFAVFLVNDIYCFISWRRMKKRQAENMSR